jgi:hypothetical protein
MQGESPSGEDGCEEPAIASGGSSSSLGPSSFGPASSSQHLRRASCSSPSSHQPPSCPSLPQAVVESLILGSPPRFQPSRSQSQPNDLSQVIPSTWNVIDYLKKICRK